MWEIWLGVALGGTGLVYLIARQFLKDKDELPNVEQVVPHDPTNTRNDSDPEAVEQFLSDEEKQSLRTEYILTSIIHKKVIAKKSKSQFSFNLSRGGEILLLPHEEMFSKRSFETASHSQLNSARDFFKDDILVKIKSMKSASNFTVGDQSTSVYSTKTCPICVEDYKFGDDIAWSRNEKCYHAYHTSCILEWLMDHDDCPMCRQDFVLKNTNSLNQVQQPTIDSEGRASCLVHI